MAYIVILFSYYAFIKTILDFMLHCLKNSTNSQASPEETHLPYRLHGQYMYMNYEYSTTRVPDILFLKRNTTEGRHTDLPKKDPTQCCTDKSAVMSYSCWNL